MFHRLAFGILANFSPNASEPRYLLPSFRRHCDQRRLPPRIAAVTSQIILG
jgi:hypothetical protein